jgi:hypothetical protein
MSRTSLQVRHPQIVTWIVARHDYKRNRVRFQHTTGTKIVKPEVSLSAQAYSKYDTSSKMFQTKSRGTYTLKMFLDHPKLQE